MDLLDNRPLRYASIGCAICTAASPWIWLALVWYGRGWRRPSNGRALRPCQVRPHSSGEGLFAVQAGANEAFWSV